MLVGRTTERYIAWLLSEVSGAMLVSDVSPGGLFQIVIFGLLAVLRLWWG